MSSTLPTDPGRVEAFYGLPLGIVHGFAAQALLQSGAGLPLGRDAAFGVLGLAWRESGQGRLCAVNVKDLPADLQSLAERLARPNPPWAGLTLDRPRIMGIINCTPDSFSDGGDHFAPENAVTAALSMVQAGADIIDVGGESTRPGAAPVSIADEIARTLPVVRALVERGVTVSIDTRHAEVMQAALQGGAAIINDIAALSEPGAMAIAAESDAAICLMHMQGEPGTMQADPHYECAPLDVYDFLARRLQSVLSAGISLDRITVDPGIGFGKTAAHNVQILSSLGLLHGLGCGILLGVSRKRLIAELSANEPPKARLPGSLGIALGGLSCGAQILRVHDVAETVQAVKMWQALG